MRRATKKVLIRVYYNIMYNLTHHKAHDLLEFGNADDHRAAAIRHDGLAGSSWTRAPALTTTQVYTWTLVEVAQDRYVFGAFVVRVVYIYFFFLARAFRFVTVRLLQSRGRRYTM